MVVGALTASACGDSDTPDPERAAGTPTSTASDAGTTIDIEDHPDGPDAGVAAVSVLNSADVPDDWTSIPTDDTPGDAEVLARVASCLGIDAASLTGGSSRAESSTLVTPENHEITSSIAVFPSEDDAIERFDLVSSPAYQTCLREEVIRLLERRITEGVTVGEPTVDQGTPRDLGGPATALRLTIPFGIEGSPVTAYQSFVIVRVGRAAATVSSFAIQTPLSDDDLAHLTRIVVDRLTGALASTDS